MLRTTIRSIASINLRTSAIPRAVAPIARASVSRILPVTRSTNAISLNPIRTFAVSSRRLSEGLVDQDLVQKLTEEIELEEEEEEKTTPAFVSDFLEKNAFKLEDKPGFSEVSLTRTFGNEKIRVTFSADAFTETMDNFDKEEDTSDSLKDDNKNQDAEFDDIDFPVEASVTVEKPGKGVINIDITAQDGSFMISDISYAKDAKVLTGEVSDWKPLFFGPNFTHLDEDLQILFERYLEERGIDTALALFIPYYVSYKEQKEYLNWLKNIKRFVEA